MITYKLYLTKHKTNPDVAFSAFIKKSNLSERFNHKKIQNIFF